MTLRLTLILALMLFSACGRLQPIHNVNNHPVTTSSGKTLALRQVRAAILQAAAQKTWTTKDIGPNELEGTLRVRSHIVRVTIKYSPTSYSIIYKDSGDLLKSGDMIHRRYNAWVKGLRITIDQKLAQL